MTRTPTGRQRGSPNPRQKRDTQVCWVNVGRSSPCHIAALAVAFDNKMDVICVQEPFTCEGSKTSTHPGYRHFSPVDLWDHTDDTTRPRVMTYIRKDNSLRAQQRESTNSRDMLWTDINGYSILNAYRQPQTPEVIAYLTTLSPPQRCLIGGDMNARHETFEPGSISAHGGAALARWATESGMDYWGTWPGNAQGRACARPYLHEHPLRTNNGQT